jgi:hypothetical protein
MTRLDPDGVSTFHTLKMRPGRAPSIARGQVVLTQTDHDHRPAPGVSQRRVPTPRHNLHHCAAPLDEPSTRVQAIRPSGLPLTCGPRMEREHLGLSPELRTPRLLAAHVGAGTDLLSTDPKSASTAYADPPTSQIHLKRATSCRTRDTGSLGLRLPSGSWMKVRSGPVVLQRVNVTLSAGRSAAPG